MLVFWLSLVMALAGCTGLVLAGKGMWQGWAIGLAVQPVWAAFAILTKGYGLLITCMMYGFVYAKNLIKWRKKKETDQATWCYCPGCKKDLVGSSERVVTDTDVVRYYCLTCHTVSKWDFDFPVPVLIDSYYLDPNDWLK